MEINDESSAIQALIALHDGSIKDVTFGKTPSTHIKIMGVEEVGFFAEELYGLLDIKKAIDDQLSEIARIAENKSLKFNSNIYYSVREGSIDIGVLLDAIKVAASEPGISKSGIFLIVGLAVVWGSTQWFQSWSLMNTSSNSDATHIKLKELDLQNEKDKRLHELQIKAIEIIKNSEELSALSNRCFSAYAKIYSNIREGSAIAINSLQLTDDQLSRFIKFHCNNDEWLDNIEGRFVIEGIKKKEKERYEIKIKNTVNNKAYIVILNMELYQKRLLTMLGEALKKGSTVWAALKLIRHERLIIRAEFVHLFDAQTNINKYKNKKHGSGRHR